MEKRTSIQLREKTWEKLARFKITFKAKDYDQMIAAFLNMVRHLNLNNEYKEQIIKLEEKR